MKTCSGCGRQKSIEYFRKNRNQCLECKREGERRRRLDDSYRLRRNALQRARRMLKSKGKWEQAKAKADAYKANRRERMIWIGARKRAAAIGVQFDLEVSDIVIPKLCPLLRIELAYRGRMANRDSSPSLDRIDPTKGYTKSNVWVISYRANRIKNDATLDELFLIANGLHEEIIHRQHKIPKTDAERTVITIEAITDAEP